MGQTKERMGFERKPRPKAWRESPIDPARLVKALHCRVEPSADLGVFLVQRAGGEPHWVNIIETDVDLCDCSDHIGRDTLCLHAIAVMLYAGDRRTLYAQAKLTQKLFVEGRLIYEVLKDPKAHSSEKAEKEEKKLEESS